MTGKAAATPVTGNAADDPTRTRNVHRNDQTMLICWGAGFTGDRASDLRYWRKPDKLQDVNEEDRLLPSGRKAGRG